MFYFHIAQMVQYPAIFVEIDLQSHLSFELVEAF